MCVRLELHSYVGIHTSINFEITKKKPEREAEEGELIMNYWYNNHIII
jgi:hypothetical protein